MKKIIIAVALSVASLSAHAADPALCELNAQKAEIIATMRDGGVIQKRMNEIIIKAHEGMQHVHLDDDLTMIDFIYNVKAFSTSSPERIKMVIFSACMEKD